VGRDWADYTYNPKRIKGEIKTNQWKTYQKGTRERNQDGQNFGGWRAVLPPKYSNFGVFSGFEVVVTSLTVRRSFGPDAVNVTLP
jgi:hypothetical protein